MRVNPEDLFNMDEPDVVKSVVLKCSEKAYQDLKRTVSYIFGLWTKKILRKQYGKSFAISRNALIVMLTKLFIKELLMKKDYCLARK